MSALDISVTRSARPRTSTRSPTSRLARDPRATRGSAALHRPHVHRGVDARTPAGTTPGSRRTARSRSTPRPRCCTTRRRSSRGSRPTGTPTARCGRSAPRPTPPGWPAPPGGSRCPELPVEDFVATVDALVSRRALGPRRAGEKSLYLRPFMFASETFLGVRPAQHVTFMVIASPGGRLLHGRGQAGLAAGGRGLHPRRPRRHGRGQDRRQLRQLAGRPAGGHRPRLRPGGVPRRDRAASTSRSSAA